MILAALGLAIVSGILAVDFGMLYGERAKAQGVADFAALAAAQELPYGSSDPDFATKIVDAAQVAEDYIAGNGYAPGEVTVNVVTEYGGNYGDIEVRVSVQKSSAFGTVFGLGDTTVGARAVARKVETVGGPLPYALVALNPTACDAFHANGNPSITIVGGGVMVNSDCTPNATSANGNVDIIVDQFDYFIDGGVELIGNASITPAPTPVLAPLVDPLLGLPAIDLIALGDSPDSGGTQGSPSLLNINNGTTTLRPGVFWGGIRVGGNANVTLGCDGAPPCIYVMAGGGFTTVGNADIYGTEALLFNTGPACAALDFGGGGDVDLTPPLSGNYENITIWQDASCAQTMTMRGNAEVFSGVVYLPSAKFDMTGTSDLGPLQVIADTIELSGNVTMTMNFQPYVDGATGVAEISLIE